VTLEVAGDGEQAAQRLAQARFDPAGRPAAAGGRAGLLRTPEGREEALRQGATWFVCKPTDGRRFRSELQRLGDHWARVSA
jgi:hypothetical protein